MIRRVAWLLALAVGACASTGLRDGVDVEHLPADVRPDYDLFAKRCSKCHPLSRPLGSGIDQDDVWAVYVARMRRQPGSGISPEDATRILRFLHFFSLEEQARKRERAMRGSPR